MRSRTSSPAPTSREPVPARFFVDPWLAPQARAQVRDRIIAIEKQTGAEIVVTVAARSGHYRHADAFFGALCSLAALLVYYFHPAPLPDDLALALAVLCYPAGVFFCAAVAPLRRLLVRKRRLRDNVVREARARFVEQGIGNTKGRTGVLVYISRFERMAEVVADVGVPSKAIASWQTITFALDAASKRGGIPALLVALDQLGAALAATVPTAAHDENELPDEVGA
jgi:putative membrane protein